MTSEGVQRLAALIRQDRYTVEEVADLLGLSAAVVRRAARSGKLAATGDRDEVSIRHEDVVRWLERRPYASEPALARMGSYYADSNRSMR